MFIYLFVKNLASCKTLCKNTRIVERGRPQMTIWLMRVACWLPKATNTHSEFPFTFPRQQYLDERATILRYSYIACLV